MAGSLALAQELRPILRRIAQQLTLLNFVTSLEEFSIEWLADPDAYRTLVGRDTLELLSIVWRLERELTEVKSRFQTEWRLAFSERNRWISNARVSAVNAMLKELRTWTRRAKWAATEFK